MSDGLAREGFDKDLRHGEAREDALVHVLLQSRVEVKSDGKCRRSGDVFIEYEQKGRPSGIATTTADRWAIEVDDDCWVILPTETLKRISRLAYQNKDRRTRGGDRNMFLGVLVPVYWLVKHPGPT